MTVSIKKPSGRFFIRRFPPNKNAAFPFTLSPIKTKIYDRAEYSD
jgi:hypothetical protein